ncbi:hypothetical protein ACTT2I_07820 [Stenotrophomonas sp. PUT21]|uniref:hypothetical protein n=1 Tax=Stenotrophomonas TaxID=40323 RepID=UPI003B8291D6
MSDAAPPEPALPRRLWNGLDEWLTQSSNRRELAIVQWAWTVSLIGCGIWVEIARRLPPVAFLVLDELIYLGIFSFISNIAMLVLMYRRRGRHSDRFKATAAVLLIVCSSLVYTGLEGVYERRSYLLAISSIPGGVKTAITFLVPFKYLFAFGFAAIGAGVFSGIISRERTGRPGT